MCYHDTRFVCVCVSARAEDKSCKNFFFVTHTDAGGPFHVESIVCVTCRETQLVHLTMHLINMLNHMARLSAVSVLYHRDCSEDTLGSGGSSNTDLCGLQVDDVTLRT